MTERLNSNGKMPSLAEAMLEGYEVKNVTGEAKWGKDMKVEFEGEVFPVVLDEHVSAGVLVLAGGIIYADCD